ncbi:MAG: hypothetical protein HDR00_10735 [Lachnospiraceae bacterium]|nr:hypothetical protein [Lachnospiraceae bacterium]
MSEREKFEEYILYGIKEEIPFKKCIEYEILLILFSLPSVIMGIIDNMFGLLGILPVVFYLVFIIKAKKGQAIEGVRYILHNGVLLIFFSFIFGLLGIDILFYLFEGKKRGIMLCAVSMGYLFAILLYSYIIRKLIERKECNNTKKVNGGLFFTLCGVFGIMAARVLLKDMDQGKAMELLCILCFFLSYLTIVGIVGIFKFWYLIKHKELLNK